MSRLAVLAITHQRASLSVLEHVALDADAAATLAHDLRDMPGTAEVVVLSTCNRTEIYLSGDAPDPVAALDALIAGVPEPGESIAESADVALDDDASMHLFRVTAGLESRIVGEQQILTQVRVAIAAATAAGTAGPQLTSLFRFAVAAGRQARRAAGRRVAPSLAALSVDVALGLQSVPSILHSMAPTQQSFPVASLPARGMSTLVVGSGVMAAAATRELSARHLDYLVCARRPGHAARLARRPEHVLDLAELRLRLVDVDAVMFATGARHPLLSAADVTDLMARRNGRDLTILDLSMPRNVDPDAALVEGVRLFDLEDLNATDDDPELRSGSRAVEEAHQQFRLWQAGQLAGETIRRLRASVLERCRVRVAEAMGPSAATAHDIDRSARAMAGRLLHEPIMTIKQLVAAGDAQLVADLVDEVVADVERTMRDVLYQVAS